MAKLQIIVRILPDGDLITVKGREAWTLLELHRAGPRGLAPIEAPAPRWSSYVHKLRTLHGVAIETLHEPHAGQFPGTHARYKLVSLIQIVARSDDRRAA